MSIDQLQKERRSCSLEWSNALTVTIDTQFDVEIIARPIGAVCIITETSIESVLLVNSG